MTPDFNRFREAILRQGEPDRVPLGDASVDIDVKSAFMGRRLQSLEDEIEFWAKAGYDYVPIPAGIRLMFSMGFSSNMTPQLGDRVSKVRKPLRAKYGVFDSGWRERVWAEEHEGIIVTEDDLEAFPWPDVDDFDFSTFERIGDLLPPGMKVIAYQGWIYTPTWMLMGFNRFCFALVEEPDLVARLFEKVCELQSALFERLISFDCVGAVWMPDDIAYTEGLMVAPEVLRQYVFPWFKWAGERCKEKGLLYIYHSDGDLREVLEDIVDAGFDALHPIEPKAMDIVQLKREYGDRLALIGNIDLGYTLTRGTPEEVEAEVKERLRVLAPGGGYAVSSSNSVPEYVPLENYNAMRETVLRYGVYPIDIP